MNRIDKDISNAIKQLRSFIAKAEYSKYQTPKEFIKNEGFDFLSYVDSRNEWGSEFVMGHAFGKYGSGLVYYYDGWTSGMIVMIVGVYADEEIEDSKIFTKNQLDGININYPERQKLLYIEYFPKNDIIKHSITTVTDGWSSRIVYKTYGYYLQTIHKFMNWDSNPLP